MPEYLENFLPSRQPSKSCKMYLLPSFVILSFLLPMISAHAVFNGFWVNSQSQNQCIRLARNSNSPITNVDSPDLRCNVGGAQGIAGVCDIKAGDTITMEMHQQPNDHTCRDKAIGGNHYGPVMIYMCQVPNAKTADGSCNWVKVAEDSYAGTTASWGTEILNSNCGKKTFTIPKNLQNGNYLVRAEVLALHTAGGKGGAQFYLSCFQINVEGGGSLSLPSGVKFPGAYNASDPGILVNIYQQNLKYKAPGPAVWIPSK